MTRGPDGRFEGGDNCPEETFARGCRIFNPDRGVVADRGHVHQGYVRSDGTGCVTDSGRFVTRECTTGENEVDRNIMSIQHLNCFFYISSAENTDLRTSGSAGTFENGREQCENIGVAIHDEDGAGLKFVAGHVALVYGVTQSFQRIFWLTMKFFVYSNSLSGAATRGAHIARVAARLVE